MPSLLLTLVAVLSAAPLDSGPAAVPLVRGHVADSQGAAVPGATVSAANDAGFQRETATDVRGDFELPLDPGIYTVRVALDGFTTTSQRVTAGHGLTERLEIVLQVAGLSEAVTVTAVGQDHAPRSPAPPEH